MAIKAPERYDVKTFKCDIPELLDHIFPYAIGFTKEHGLSWSIVLSFLFPPKDISDFRVRLSKLFTDENQGAESFTEGMILDLYDFLNKYNPFRNRYSCFYNESLKRVVKKFDKTISAFLRNRDIKKTLRKRDKNVTSPFIDKYVIVACIVLKNDIALCDIREKTVHIFPSDSNRYFSETTPLTLYVSSGGNNKLNYVLYYGIEQTFGHELRKKALNSILLTADVFYKNVQLILKGFSAENNNILLTLLRLNMYPVIFLLFKQPHILLKLEEADFCVDPSVPDSLGESALYYALESNEERLVIQFYNYLSGAIHLSDVSPRNPKKSIFENLERLRSILEEHRSKFENTKTPSVFLEQLIKFNSFQIAMDTKLLEADEHLTDNRDKVERKKKKIIDVLCTYAEYFDFEDNSNLVSTADSDTEKFVILQENFKNYKRYYQIIDFNAALFFFDNLFSLKENLTLNDNAYERIESNFLRFLLMCSFYNFSEFFPCNCAFSNMRKFRKSKIPIMPRSPHCRIVYMERLKLRKHLGKFKDLLTETRVQDDKIRFFVPDSDVETLVSLPEIRDVLIFRTVVHYLDVASKIEFNCSSQDSVMETQGVLIIERALQVLGEHLNERLAGSVSLGKSLLVSFLSADIRKNLRDIRDELSHVDAKRVECRRNAENCRETFEGIVTELRTIRSKIEDSHRLLELLATKYVLSTGRSHLKEIKKVHGKKKGMGTDEKTTLLCKHVTEEDNILLSTIDDIRRKICSYSLFCHFHIHFEYISHYMSENSIVSEDDSLKKTLFHFRCLKTLYTHRLQVVKIKSNRKKLTEVINLIEVLENNFTGSKTSRDEIRETVEEKVLIMTNYEGIFKESMLLESQAVPKKKKRRNCHISKQNIQGTHYTCLYVLPFVGKNYSFSKRKFGIEEEDLCSEDMEDNIGEINYSFIENMKNDLLYLYPINEEEKCYIIDQVPLRFKEHSNAKSYLLRVLRGECEQELTDEEIKDYIQKLLSSKGRKELKEQFSDRELKKTNIDTLEGIKDYAGDLIQTLNNNEMISGTDYKQYCQYCSEDMKLLSDEKSRELLKKCVKGRRFKAKNDTILKHLRDKIIILENLLITSDPRLGRIWSEVKSSKTKRHIVYRIKERYVRDFNLQAAVEMLLFDCMNILERRRDLEQLWTKVSCLFNGINLRNVLAHGNLLYEEVGRILDPDDLPSEIITKCLELVDDKSTIEAMCELLTKRGGTREDFTAAVRSKHAYADICETISRCARWESYASLIPKT